MLCPPGSRDELQRALVALYPAGVIDVREGGDIRKLHQPSGKLGSTLDYLMRFKSQQAWWGDKSTPRETIPDMNGRRRGVKAPLLASVGAAPATSPNAPSTSIGTRRPESVKRQSLQDGRWHNDYERQMPALRS